jgi:Flp pilus assembly pilin Flp
MCWLAWLQLHYITVLRRISARVSFDPFVREKAQGLVEYGLILLMVVVVCIAVVTLLGNNVSGVWYQKILDKWPT